MPKDVFDITVVSIFKDKFPQNINGVKYRWIFPFRFRGHVKLLRLIPQKLLYRLIVGNRDFDLVVSYWEGVTMRIVGGKPAEKKTKIINWIHTEFKDLTSLRRLFKSYREFTNTMLRYDATVFVADSAKKSLCNLLPEIKERSHTIYNIIYPDDIIKQGSEPIDPQHLNHTAFNIVSVGRIVEVKAFDRLIRLVKQAKDLKLNVRLYIIGTGRLRQALINEASRLEVIDRVVFLGWQSNPHKYVAKADLFVCSSLHEGYSTAVSEALILGTPVITTLCSGMEELLGYHGEYGMVVPNDEKALIEAVIDVLNDPIKLKDLKERAVQRSKIFNTQMQVEANVNFLKWMASN